ncbi:MAG: beta-ketoacyl-ACP synthase II [Anaerolineales bacterium]|nr:beta-ketoacyl-ACP synthase II [Anaerolineales bacterium]
MSAITPVGNTVSESWEALKAGRSGATRIVSMDASKYSCQIGCELKGFDPLNFIPAKKARNMADSSQVAVAAAIAAIEDAAIDLEQIDKDHMAVLLGTAGGSGVQETEIATRQLASGRSARLSPFQILKAWPNMPSFFIANMYKFRGYSGTVTTACAAATQAIGDAARLIQTGEADMIITGGTEYMVSDTAMAGFTAMRALATSYNDNPEKAMRPFDADREGFIAGGGSGILILESLDHALQRGARIYAEVLGSGTSNDAFHMIIPDPEGGGASLAIKRSLDSAGVGIEDIDYINAHGTSTPVGDLMETKAIKSVFGERAYKIPINSTKSMVGHMMGATGALEAIVCVMSIREGIIHPTINYETPDPECDLDYVPNEAREAQVDIALSNSFGLGGQNACLVIGRFEA